MRVNDERFYMHLLYSNNDYPILSERDEKRIGKKLLHNKPGSMEYKNAKEKLIMHNLKLVPYFINHSTNYKLPYSELCAAGNYGLVQAANHYDCTKGKFSTYAGYWIRQSINRCAKNYFSVVEVPDNVTDKLIKLSNLDENGLSDDIIKEELSCNESELDSFRKLAYNRYGLSLDSAFDEIEDDSDFHNIISVPQTEFENELIWKSSIDSALNDLTPRNAYIIRRLFGIDNVDRATLEELANELGVSTEAIRKSKNRSLKKIKTKLYSCFI